MSENLPDTAGQLKKQNQSFSSNTLPSPLRLLSDKAQVLKIQSKIEMLDTNRYLKRTLWTTTFKFIKHAYRELFACRNCIRCLSFLSFTCTAFSIRSPGHSRRTNAHEGTNQIFAHHASRLTVMETFSTFIQICKNTYTLRLNIFAVASVTENNKHFHKKKDI